MRKALGARSLQIARQFRLESALMTFMAFILGLMMAAMLLPVFETLLQTNLTRDYIVIFYAGVATILLGMAAGSYPALMISRFRTVDVFKGHFKIGGSNAFTRCLVVLQFVISICLIVATLMLTKQLRFLQQHNLGFNPENVIVVLTQIASDRENDSGRLLEHYKNELSDNPNTVSITGASGSFQRGFALYSFFTMEDGRVMDVASYGVDEDFIETMDLDLIQGRNFREGDTENAMIVNETFMQTFSDIARLNREFPYPISMRAKRNIIGVVRDFHFESLRKHVMPAALIPAPRNEAGYRKINCILVRTKPGQNAQVVKTLESIWQKHRPHEAFQFDFMQDDIRRQYQAEERWQQISSWAGMLAILIASLGIFGLISVTTMHRRKEIGIRKIFGASMLQILKTLNRDYMKLFLVASAIACAISFILADKLLQGFAYRTSLGIVDLLTGSLIVLVITAAVTSSRTIVAAIVNPVETLRPY